MKILKVNNQNLKEIVKVAAELIKKGKIVICPTDTIYGLVCDATNKKAVEKIFKIKKRNFQKPISIFVEDLRMAKKLAKIDKNQEKLLSKFWPGKVIAIFRAKKRFPRGIVCRRGKIGLRMPNYKLLNEALNKFGGPLAQTSANLAGKPTPVLMKSILKQLKNKKYRPDLAIDAGKLSGKSSMVIDLTQSPPKILPRS